MNTKSCDILVIGGGGSGLTAGCRAASLGKKVIVLEKADYLGGGMNHASTMRTFGSKWQAERGLPDTTAQYMRNRMDETFWRVDLKFASAIIRGTGAFFDWFCEEAPKETVDLFEVGRYVFDEDDGPLGPQRSNRKYGKGGGRVFVEFFSEKLSALGSEILMGAVTDSLIVKDGKVCGAVVHCGGEELEITCSAVILACGAWIRNSDFVEKHYPMLADAQKYMDTLEEPHQNRNYTGDGLALAAAAGAKMDETNLTVRMMGPGIRTVGTVPANISRSAYCIYVNTDGKRYISEPSIPRIGVFDSGIIQMYQPTGRTYVIFDMNTLSHAVADGENQPQPQIAMPFTAAVLPSTLGEALADLDNAIAKNSDVVFKADSLEELADMIGINKENFLRTVADYNGYCASGMDWDCYKPSEWLVPIDQGPFFAVKTSLNTDGAFGGVIVDERMRVISDNGGTVAGLYAAGDIASGRFINMADVKKQILNDMSFALSSGFIAGTDAASAVG